MTTPHVRDDLQPWLDGRLPADRGRAVAEHLLACRECRELADELRLGQSFAQQLRRAEAPDALWERIAGRSAPSRSAVAPRFAARRLAAAIAFFIVSVGAGWTALAWYRASQWELRAVAGTTLLGERAVSGDVAVGAGDRVTTGAGSRARLTVGNIGTTDVAPGSRLRVIATRPSEHRLELERGSIHAKISAPPRLFVVETPTATAIDLGCEYDLTVDSAGGSRLHVTLGWVALEDGRHRTLVPMGTVAITRPGVGIGLPVYLDASAAFRASARALEEHPEDEFALGILLTESRRRDAVTVWHLMRRLDGRARARAALRLAELVPPPRDVRLADAIALQERAMDRWLEEIEPAWSVIREPGWKRVVTGVWEYVASRAPSVIGHALVLSQLRSSTGSTGLALPPDA